MFLPPLWRIFRVPHGSVLGLLLLVIYTTQLIFEFWFVHPIILDFNELSFIILHNCRGLIILICWINTWIRQTKNWLLYFLTLFLSVTKKHFFFDSEDLSGLALVFRTFYSYGSHRNTVLYFLERWPNCIRIPSNELFYWFIKKDTKPIVLIFEAREQKIRITYEPAIKVHNYRCSEKDYKSSCKQ